MLHEGSSLARNLIGATSHWSAKGERVWGVNTFPTARSTRCKRTQARTGDEKETRDAPVHRVARSLCVLLGVDGPTLVLLPFRLGRNVRPRRAVLLHRELEDLVGRGSVGRGLSVVGFVR